MSRPVAAPALGAVTALLLAACSPPPASAPDPAPAATEAAAQAAPDVVDGPPPLVSSGDFAWPASVAAFGDGYPRPGDPCRKLGEAPATADFLDHTLDLVGCPGGPDTPAARALIAAGGHLNGQHDGVTMISMPRPPGSSG